MFDFLKRKKQGEENASAIEGVEALPVESSTVETSAKQKTTASAASASTSAGVESLKAEIEKIKASVEAFGEIRKSFAERFNQISENIGQLRQMIMDGDKSMQEVELKALKAYDLVNTVQPEKTMIELQKQEAKIEALNANLEGNEAIMDKIMEELKEAKRKIQFFRGVEEIAKLSEETKKELIDIKKVESRININTDKVETIYVEMRKRFQAIDVFDSELKEQKVNVEQNMKDAQMLKEKMTTLASKEDLDTLVHRVKRYIEVLKELEKKSSMTRDIDRLRDILEGMKE